MLSFIRIIFKIRKKHTKVDLFTDNTWENKIYRVDHSTGVIWKKSISKLTGSLS